MGNLSIISNLLTSFEVGSFNFFTPPTVSLAPFSFLMAPRLNFDFGIGVDDFFGTPPISRYKYDVLNAARAVSTMADSVYARPGDQMISGATNSLWYMPFPLWGPIRWQATPMTYNTNTSVSFGEDESKKKPTIPDASTNTNAKPDAATLQALKDLQEKKAKESAEKDDRPPPEKEKLKISPPAPKKAPAKKAGGGVPQPKDPQPIDHSKLPVHLSAAMSSKDKVFAPSVFGLPKISGIYVDVKGDKVFLLLDQGNKKQTAFAEVGTLESGKPKLDNNKIEEALLKWGVMGIPLTKKEDLKGVADVVERGSGIYVIEARNNSSTRPIGLLVNPLSEKAYSLSDQIPPTKGPEVGVVKHGRFIPSEAGASLLGFSK